jgi:hypothetical protein
VAALITLWGSVPGKDKLMKIKADEFYADLTYDEGSTSQIFRNYYSSRAALISKRACAKIPKPPLVS